MISRSSDGYASHRERGAQGRRLRRLITVVVLFVTGYLVVHTLFIQTIGNQSESMLPTLAPGDRVMMSPLSYGPRIRLFGWTLPGISRPQRGDLVALRPGFMDEPAALRRLANPLVRFATLERARLDDGVDWRSATQLRRIVGIPGDTVRMERFVVYVQPAGSSRFSSESELAVREYDASVEPLPDGWRSDDPFGDSMDEIHLGPDEYFVIGDNRTLSIDSRHWGTVSSESIHGRVFFRYWPLGRAGSP